MQVPGGRVPGMETGASLLDLAVWSLREQGLVEVEQIRPVAEERVVKMGGPSFSRVRAAGKAALGGLEGALLEKIAEPPEQGLLGRFDDLLAQKLSGDDEDGLRGHILALDLSTGSPWTAVANHCVQEARDAGILEVTGRLRKKMSVIDPGALEALRPRNEEIAAARDAYRKNETQLDGAVFGDCVAALDWAHQSSD